MMKKTVLTLAGSALLAGLALPMAATAAEEDLLKRIDALSKEVELLKGQVKKVDDKSLGKWLTIGGDYRFRVDSLHGKTEGYTNAPNFMGALQSSPATSGFFATPQAQQMLSSTSYSAVAGLTPNAMMGNFVNYMANTPSNPYYGDPAGAQAYLQSLGQGAYVPAYKPKNTTLYTNKFGLDLHAKATQDVTVTVKLDMYKAFGSSDDNATTGNYFADRVGVFDGTVGHVPSDSKLNVDRAYATWSNILDEPVWFSVGRRPSTNGAPSNLRMNTARPGSSGAPALLVDYAFDGGVLGYAPDIDGLPGASAKLCYGRGFDAGIDSNATTNSLKDTDMVGVAVFPIDTDPLRVWLQWNRGMNIFDFPVMSNSAFGDTAPSVNLGDIDWYGTGFMSTLKNVGPGTLNFFGDFGLSVTHPNNRVSANAGFQGLGTGGFLAPEAPDDKTGWAAYLGVRYDLPSRTKLGFEYNHGSKNWITFAPAADDMWTSKVGTRGNVFEPYIIQELDLKPISSYTSKVFFKIGYQYYDFEYTGSNNWVGAPQKISDIKSSDLLLLTPLKSAQNIYATFEVQF
jgi:hypothetical protein